MTALDPLTDPLSVSIVVPTLDEEPALGERLPRTLAASRRSRGLGRRQPRSHGGVGTVAGRSRGRRIRWPRTAAEPRRRPGARRGAAFPPRRHRPARRGGVAGAHRDRGRRAGRRFQVRFDADALVYRLGAATVNLRSRWTRLALGDQAQFVRRELFERLGGFPPWPILEDLDFARRLRRSGKTVILSPPVVTSARRSRLAAPRGRWRSTGCSGRCSPAAYRQSGWRSGIATCAKTRSPASVEAARGFLLSRKEEKRLTCPC